eukprot:Em0002g1905a
MLRLMKEMPKSVEEALRLATQQEAVETAQKRSTPSVTYAVNEFLHNPAVGPGYSKKLHKLCNLWQGPFQAVKVLVPNVYRIADCANPKRQKVVHFNRLKPAPEEAEAPSPEVSVWPSTPGQPTDPLDALPNGVGEQNVMKIPLLTLQLVITMKILYLPLYQWSLRIDNLSLGQLQMFQTLNQSQKAYLALR